MKKFLYIATMLISVVACNKGKNSENRADSIDTYHKLYECIVLKGDESTVNVHVRINEKPDGMYASGGNFFWINFIEAPEQIEVPKSVPEKSSVPLLKIKRSYIVILKEGETVDYVSRYGFIVRTWDRAIRVRYIYEE